MPRGKRNNYNYYYPQRSLAVGKRNKYATMTFYAICENPQSPTYKPYITVVNPANIEGMRKVKNISIQLSYDASYIDPEDGTVKYIEEQRILWAIVYVPRGSEPGRISDKIGALYTPPQFVMSSGIYDTNQPGNASRIFTPLSRNLNSGDGIAFVFYPLKPLYGQQLSAVINYAITLQ